MENFIWTSGPDEYSLSVEMDITRSFLCFYDIASNQSCEFLLNGVPATCFPSVGSQIFCGSVDIQDHWFVSTNTILLNQFTVTIQYRAPNLLDCPATGIYTFQDASIPLPDVTIISEGIMTVTEI
jgi:hypothetical protein